MTVARRDVLRLLGEITDAETRHTTTVETLVSTLDADRAVVERHLATLETCDLVRLDPENDVRVTVTGEELLAPGIEGLSIVGPPSGTGRGDST